MRILFSTATGLVCLACPPQTRRPIAPPSPSHYWPSHVRWGFPIDAFRLFLQFSLDLRLGLFNEPRARLGWLRVSNGQDACLPRGRSASSVAPPILTFPLLFSSSYTISFLLFSIFLTLYFSIGCCPQSQWESNLPVSIPHDARHLLSESRLVAASKIDRPTKWKYTHKIHA